MSILGLGDKNSVQYFDVKSGKWVTHIPKSPPIPVTRGGSLQLRERGATVGQYHMAVEKEADVSVYTASQPSSPAKRRNSAKEENRDGVIDLTLAMDSPTTKRNKINHRNPRSLSPTPICETENQDIGSRPARLSAFPARSVGEMDTRFRWINDNGSTGGGNRERFRDVFSCGFISSTFYSHQRAWRWLTDKQRLSSSDPSDSWLRYAQEAWIELDKEKVRSRGSLKEPIVVEGDE